MAENNFDELTAKLLSSNIETSTKVTESELEEFRNRLVEKEKTVDIFSSANKGYITALDIDISNNATNDIVEERVNQHIKKRVRFIVKRLKEDRKIQNNTESTENLVSDEEFKTITQQVTDDDETKVFRQQTVENVLSQKTNFGEMRKTMEGLNDLNEFSASIEKLGLQKVDKFLTYEAIVKLSFKYNNMFFEMIDKRKQSVQQAIKALKENNSSIESEIPMTSNNGIRSFDVNKVLQTMDEMYDVTKDIDDIELYERFNMETNIEWSHRLSYICGKMVANGDNFTNPVNEHRNYSTGLIQSLTKHNIISNKLLYTLLGDEFVSTNRITVYDNMYANTKTNNKVYVTRTLGELLLMITNPKLSSISKDYRKQLYTSYNGTRPSSSEYYTWSGLQVFDIDLKEWVSEKNGDVDKLKKAMFEKLTDFHWFLWICKSSSGRGLHIYTKVSPAHHIYNTPEENEYISRYWYTVSYVTKLNIVYSVLNALSKESNNGIEFDDVFENPYVDNTVGRITSGIRISYDAEPLVNHNFIDLHPAVLLGQTLAGLSRKEMNELFFRQDDWENFTDNNIRKRQPNYINTRWIHTINEELAVGDLKTFRSKQETESSVDMSKYITIGGDATEITPMERRKINYVSRYNVCNTLAALFGKDGLDIAHVLLDSKRCGNVNEINSFYSCALSNKKQPSKLGLEILKEHGIIKTVDERVTEVVEEGFKFDLKRQIEKAVTNEMVPVDYDMKPDEYLSHYNNELRQRITGSKINIILSPPNSGKTVKILQWAKEGKRILLVLPYISVIKNKVETDKDVTDLFDCFYGSKDFRDIEYGRNIVTTFDKFSRANAEKLAHMFDYICIDESHLLFTSSYRIETTSNAVKRLKELYYYSSNDPFAAKILLFTGTSTGEYVHFSKIGNFITFRKKSHTKRMEFLICDDTLDALTRLSAKAADLINTGYKLLIPTNKGEIYSEKVIGMVEYLLGRNVKYGYYKRSNSEEEICRMINEQNTVGDYDIVFCSNYLSVGVDIVDKCEFASIYLGAFSGYEIEQFNARIRRTGIRSVYCLPTNDSSGHTNILLMEEPNLVLKLTDEDQLKFIDDKSIAMKKQDVLAQYDPITKRITTPGFGVVNGKIDFRLEEYELVTFEDKFTEVMTHPIKVARELAKYGYEISVSTEFEGLSKTEQEELRKVGIASARNEKIRKHTLLVGTYLDLIQQNTYINTNGLEFVGLIEWIAKHPDKIQEDRDCDKFVYVDWDVFATPQMVFVRSKEALDKMLKPARHLIRRYSVKRCIDIISEYVNEDGVLSIKKFQRAINLLKLIDSSDAGELSETLMVMMNKMYEFVDTFESSPNYYMSYENYRTMVDGFTNQYLEMLGITLHTEYGFQKVRDSITEMLQDIATKSTSQKGVRFSYNKLPEQNSSAVLNRRSIDTLVENMFKLNSTLIDSESKKVRTRHIVLEKQEF